MKQLLIIGIDGGTWGIIDQAIKSGYMPRLKKLKRLGNYGELDSVQPPLTPAAWAAFHTGKDSGSHGIIDFVYLNREIEEIEVFDSNWLGSTVWHKLNQLGNKVCLINVPLTYPPFKVNGVIISGLLTPNAESNWTHPTSYKKRILSQLPNYQPAGLNIPNPQEVAKNEDQFIDNIRQTIKLRSKLAQWLIKKGAFDVLMVHFQLIDWIQHALWPYLDPQHSQFNKLKQKKIFSLIYQPLDEIIGSLWNKWQRTSDNPALLVLSDHGFQRHKKRILLGNLFYQQGLLDKHGGKKAKINLVLRKFGPELKDISPFKLTGHGSWGFIYLKSAKDSKKILKTIEPICSQITDPKTNKKIIKKVWQRTDLYSGTRLKSLPNILIEPVNGYSITTAIDKSGKLFQPVEWSQDFHLGTHHQTGMVLSSLKKKLPNKIVQMSQFILNVVK